MNSILSRLAAFCIVVSALAPAALADRNRYSRDCDRDYRYVRYDRYDRYSNYGRYDRCDPYYSSGRYDPYYTSSRYDPYYDPYYRSSRYDRYCDDRVSGYVTYRTGGRYDYRTRRTSPQFSISLRF